MKQRLALAQSALEKLCARRGNAWYPIFSSGSTCRLDE